MPQLRVALGRQQRRVRLRAEAKPSLICGARREYHHLYVVALRHCQRAAGGLGAQAVWSPERLFVEHPLEAKDGPPHGDVVGNSLWRNSVRPNKTAVATFDG